MDPQDDVAKTPSAKVDDFKGDIEHDDKGGLETLPVLQYNGPTTTTGEVSVLYPTMIQYGWTALWCLLATSGTLSISYQNTISDNMIRNTGFLASVGESGLGAGGARAFDPGHINAWSGSHTGGFLLMSLTSCIPSDYFGRKSSLLLAPMLTMVAFLVQMLARDWRIWLVSRLFTGMATGLNQCAVIAYLSEASPSRIRGASLVSYQLALCTGQLLATLAECFLALAFPKSYRHLLLSQLAFSVPAVLAIAFLPESPTCIHKPTYRSEGYDGLGREWMSIEYTTLMAELEDDQDRTFRSLTRGSNLRRLFISTFPSVWQYWLGVPVVMPYFTYFFQLAGVIDTFPSQFTMYLLLVAGAILSMFLVDKVGRRPLMLWLPPVMIVSLFAVAGLVRHAPRSWSGGILTTLGCLWVACYGTSVGPLAFVYLGEVSNGHLKAKTISIATTIAGLLNAVALYCTPLMIAVPILRLFTAACLFGCVGLAGWFVCYFCIPETRGLSSLELEEVFRKRVPGPHDVRSVHS